MIMAEHNKFQNFYALIMSGGRGERFWPLSTEEKPKPFLPLFNGKSLIQLTVERISKLFPLRSIFLILATEHYPVALQQLKNIPENNFIVEPCSKDTAPCAAYASLYISKMHPDATIIVFPSDHYVRNEKEFARCVRNSYTIVQKNDGIITFGIKPTRPDTNYGYIEAGKKISLSKNNYYYEVSEFKEKPDEHHARLYVKKSNFYWNGGIFVWKTATLMKLINQHEPLMYTILQEINNHFGSTTFTTFLEKKYHEFKSSSIDYCIMEKTKPIYMVPATFIWDDIGTWSSLFRILPGDNNKNIYLGKVTSFETEDCLIYPDDAHILSIGIKDIIAIKHNNNILLIHKDYAHKLKQYLKESKKKC